LFDRPTASPLEVSRSVLDTLMAAICSEIVGKDYYTGGLLEQTQDSQDTNKQRSKPNHETRKRTTEGNGPEVAKSSTKHE